jgi:hypothetical protein
MMNKAFSPWIAAVVLTMCAACEPGPRNKNQRDPKLERQRQQINSAVGKVEMQLDRATLEAKKMFEDVKRDALVVQGNVERKLAQVDQAAQAYIDQSKKLGELAGAASNETEKAKQALQGMLGYGAPQQQETPKGP